MAGGERKRKRGDGRWREEEEREGRRRERTMELLKRRERKKKQCENFDDVMMTHLSFLSQVYKPEETLAVFFVVNVTDKPLANTTITLSAPSNLKMGKRR